MDVISPGEARHDQHQDEVPGFTLGPWDAMGVVVISLPAQRVIAKADYGNGTTFEEAKHNARVMAAAPELRWALMETWRVLRAAGLLNLSNGVQLGQTSWYVKACDAEALANAALAKADGR